MFCYHCGKKIDEEALEKKKSSYDIENTEVDSDAQVNYVCPQCGHLIHANASEEDLKSLSRATHSQLQRGANHFNFGMGFVSFGVIIGVLAFAFLLLSYKTSGGVKYLKTTCSEFYVFCIFSVIAVGLLAFGLYHTIIGLSKKKMYKALLKDLNNKTFVQ